MIPSMLALLMAGGASKEFAYVTQAFSSTAGSTFTFSSTSIGAANADRIIMVAVLANGASTRTISSVTLGGNAMTNVVTRDSTSNAASIRKLAVPSGTTANIVVNLSGSHDRCLIAVYRFVGAWADLTSAATTTASSNVFSVTNNTALGGVTLVATSAFSSGGPPTLNSQVGWTPDYQTTNSNNRFAVGSKSPDAAATGATHSATYSAVTSGVLVAATFQ